LSSILYIYIYPHRWDLREEYRVDGMLFENHGGLYHLLSAPDNATNLIVYITGWIYKELKQNKEKDEDHKIHQWIQVSGSFHYI